MTPVAAVEAAIRHVAPKFAEPHEAAWLVVRWSWERGLDPFLMVAYVARESGWRPSAELDVNELLVEKLPPERDERYVGLGQVRLRNFPECRGLLTEPACLAVREQLLEWRSNLRITLNIFYGSRAICRQRFHSVDPRWWVRIPTGWDAREGTFCGHSHGRPTRVPRAVTELLKQAASLSHAQTQTRNAPR